MRRLVACAVPLFAASLSLADGLTVIDFDQFEFANANTNNVGNVVQEDGFTFTKGDGEPFEYAVYGQDNSNYTGSASLFNNTVGGLIRLTHDNGQPFEMVSIDVANLGGGGPTVVNFTGFTADGDTVNTTFTHSTTGPIKERFTFPLSFNNLVALEWTQDSPFHQFDNVAVGKGSVVTKFPDQGAFWNPLDPDGSYVYANSFVASETGTIEELGAWLNNGDNSGGPSIRFEVWGSIGGNPANGPDAGNVIATTGSLSLPGIDTLRLYSAETRFSDVVREGTVYWFVATCVGEAGPGSWQVGGHTQGADGGTFWYSNDPAGVNFDGQGLTPEMGFTLDIGRGGIQAYYLDRGVFPWNDEAEYSAAMDAAFPMGWVRETYDTVNTSALFNKKTRFIYMEGSDSSADELASFLAANGGALGTWVNQGGTLLLNAAPNEGGNINFGFGGVTLNYPDFGSQANAVDADHQVFNGPFGVVTTSYTGNSFAHATISGGGTMAILRNENNAIVLSEKKVGKGGVVFGGMTSAGFHDPDPDSQLLLNNIVDYAASLGSGSLIQFDEYEIDNASVNAIGSSILEDGFVFVGDPAWSFFGRREARYPGSAALFSNVSGGLIRVEHAKGLAFDACSIDIAPLNSATPVTVNFTGYKAGGGTVNATYNHPGTGLALETYKFPNSFVDLVAIEWTQASPFHQFDNLRLTLPENMTFDRFRFDDATSHGIGDAVSEDAYTITKADGEAFPFTIRGARESAYAGSPGVYNNTVNGLMHLERVNGDAFDMASIDIAPLNSATPVTVNFTGFKAGGGTVNASFTHSGVAVEYETFMFPGNFTNLASLEWTQASPFHQFDNVTMGGAVLPCPGDCDGNGVLNILDFVCFQTAWVNQTPYGDCDGNGLYNILDFVCYQGLFQQGCP